MVVVTNGPRGFCGIHLFLHGGMMCVLTNIPTLLLKKYKFSGTLMH